MYLRQRLSLGETYGEKGGSKESSITVISVHLYAYIQETGADAVAPCLWSQNQCTQTEVSTSECYIWAPGTQLCVTFLDMNSYPVFNF